LAIAISRPYFAAMKIIEKIRNKKELLIDLLMLFILVAAVVLLALII
jgi:hypothetical protein